MRAKKKKNVSTAVVELFVSGTHARARTRIFSEGKTIDRRNHVDITSYLARANFEHYQTTTTKCRARPGITGQGDKTHPKIQEKTSPSRCFVRVSVTTDYVTLRNHFLQAFLMLGCESSPLLFSCRLVLRREEFHPHRAVVMPVTLVER